MAVRATRVLVVLAPMLSQMSLIVTSLPADVVDLSANDSNKTIVMGYFLQSDPRIVVIGMAIEQAQADGLLPGYGFK
jgi:hypothetical protein